MGCETSAVKKFDWKRLQFFHTKKSSHGSPPPEYSEITTIDLDNTDRSTETYLESTPVITSTEVDQENQSDTENDLNLSCFPCD